MIASQLSVITQPWVLTGSTAFHIQGLPFEPNDIDLQSTERGAYETESALTHERTIPVQLSQTTMIRSHFGRGRAIGWTIEIMGAVEKLDSKGVWTRSPPISQLRRWLSWRGISLPVFDLTYEAKAYEMLGRADRARLIRRHATAHNARREP
jgi:hypothetical protein